MQQHQLSRASRPVRVLGLLVVILGITAMHTGGFHLGSDTHHASSSLVSVTAAPTLHDEVTIGGGDYGLGHDAVHACVLILSTLTLAIGLVLLYRAGHLSPGIEPAPRAASWRMHRERPPPWAGPSLAELSILRI
ncbi:DUF6153 family protein [Nocardia arthritidis]|uniref:DUF6153 family protein n=1 Tax=Nocardia arthritidis TaxID=228602 RepID=UPI0007A3B5CE|nr:DUF6153 family protein [Nocardia arthritidis]